MGRPTDPNFWQQSPPPQTGDMNNERTLNQRFMRELPGALPPQDVIIHDGAISGFESAALIVDTEGEAAADELNVINIVLSANENLHPGMIITLRAKDQARTVTVKNSAAANGINTAGGHDVVLSTEWDLVLRLVAGRWYEIQTRGDVRASDAQTDASTALARTNPATTTSRGIGRVATLADMGPDAVIENGPAFLAAGSDALNALVPTFLIGSIITTYAADGYVPNGCVLPDGAEYTQTQFPSFYTDYLVAGKIVTCTYTEFAAQVALTGNCGKFALDTVNKKFKVPLLKDGDSITHATSAGEIGKSITAGLPNITGTFEPWSMSSNAAAAATGAFKIEGSGINNSRTTGSPGTQSDIFTFDPSRVNSIYGNSNTVTDEQVRLRHFVVLASAQNNSSMFDWSNYMAALAGKANNDLSNLAPEAGEIIRQNTIMRSLGTRETQGEWTLTGVKPGRALVLGIQATAATQNPRAVFRVKSGSDIGNALYSAPGSNGAFMIGRNTGYVSSCSAIIKPTSTTVVIGLDVIVDAILYAEQI